MRTTWPKRIGAMAVLVVVCALVVVLVRQVTWEPEDFWSARPDLSESEKAYVLQAADRLLEQWRRTRQELYARPGQASAPYDVYLVVDANEPAMWIERDGQVWDGERMDLPAKLEWSLHRTFVEGTEPLPARGVFKIRGWATGPELAEMVYVVGSIPGGGHVAFIVSPSRSGSDFGSGAFRPILMALPERDHEPGEWYPSIVVSEEEYEAARSAAGDASAPAGDARGAAPKRRRLAEQRADWTRIEAKLYRELERRLDREGQRPISLTVIPGPDFHAGHADISGRPGLIAAATSSGPPLHAELNFDLLGDGVWYVHSVPSAMPGPVSGQLDLEFLLSEGESVPGSEPDWLAKGREVVRQPHFPSSGRTVVLPGGTEVEFIGLCRAPGFGEQWWGPNGSPLPASPCISMHTSPFGEPGNRFEIAWKTIGKDPSAPARLTCSVSGAKGRNFYTPMDRYGRRVKGLHYGQYSFDEGQKTTTVRIGIGPDEAQTAWVEFRNISLVPGKDFGFTMAVVGAEE